MNMADEESLYLDNLDEFINDQDKVVSIIYFISFLLFQGSLVVYFSAIFSMVFQVTYKWLSRTLSVASNTAKQ